MAATRRAVRCGGVRVECGWNGGGWRRRIGARYAYVYKEVRSYARSERGRVCIYSAKQFIDRWWFERCTRFLVPYKKTTTTLVSHSSAASVARKKNIYKYISFFLLLVRIREWRRGCPLRAGVVRLLHFRAAHGASNCLARGCSRIYQAVTRRAVCSAVCAKNMNKRAKCRGFYCVESSHKQQSHFMRNAMNLKVTQKN